MQTGTLTPDTVAPPPRPRRWVKAALAGAAVAVAVVIAVLLAGGDEPEVIEPTPTTVATTTTVPATTTTVPEAVPFGELIVGTWSSGWGEIEFLTDDTFVVRQDNVITDEGTFRYFEAGLQLTFVSVGSERCGDGRGTYSYALRPSGDINLSLLGDDCDNRAITLDFATLSPVSP